MKTTETIYEEMKALYGDLAGGSPGNGGDLELRLYAAAAQLYSLWEQAEFVLRQSFPQTAVGVYLDRHGEVRGVTRREASRAVGTLRFSLQSPAAGAVNVPAGTNCTDGEGRTFETTQAGLIPAGSLFCDVPARAVLPGAAGNVPAETVVYMMRAPVGVAGCVNPQAFSDGSDGETDDALRQRILASYRKLPNGANIAYYETQALNVDGVAGVAVLPKNRGVGTVDVVISAESGLPSQALLEQVREKLQAQRELCVDLQVLSPRSRSINVTVTVYPDPAYDGDAVCNEVRTRLKAYFSGTRLGKRVLRAELSDIIYSTEGVVNYSLSVPTADVSIDPDMLPRLGTLRVTKGG